MPQKQSVTPRANSNSDVLIALSFSLFLCALITDLIPRLYTRSPFNDLRDDRYAVAGRLGVREERERERERPLERSSSHFVIIRGKKGRNTIARHAPRKLGTDLDRYTWPSRFIKLPAR